ncbi:MFS transporter [Halobaculum rubrum]|uniref:MFS transporter n=1 Tax=Halobaculum rubrum TaxID=2872158 RepID=UPI001CA4075F|nr:MFS transporter [Halobaculum rubrum]QZY00453.1 MFS transporter [Halobaculum rubrum]
MNLPSARRPRVDRGTALVGLAAVTRVTAGALLGTSLAVHVGRTGSALEVSLLATAFSLGIILFAPVWGAFADVTGRRKLILVGTGLGATLALTPLFAVDAVANAASATLPVSVDPVWIQVLVRGLYAVFIAGFGPLMLTVASERGGPAGRGKSVGSYNAFTAAGSGAGQFTSGLLLGALVPGDVYLVVAAVSLLATVAVALVDPGDTAPDPDAESLPREIRSRLLPAAGERGHLSTNGLGWLYLGLSARQATVSGVGALMPVYIVATLGLPEAWMGAVLAFNPVSQTALMYYLGGVVDDHGRKPMITLGMAGSAVFGLVAAAAVFAPGGIAAAGVVALGYVTLAVAFSAMWTGSVAFVADVAPENRESELMGLASTARSVGGVVGPLGVGAVATVAGYPTAFVAASVLALGAAAVVSLRVAESRPAVAGAGVATGVPADD